jgi:hypothetical protein
MADHCNICDTRRPIDGTKAMMLGDMWVEFCENCKDTPIKNQETGEEITVQVLYDRITLRRTQHDSTLQSTDTI